MIIVFGEVLEASLTVGILYTYLRKINQPEAINGDPSAIELLAWITTVLGLGYMWKEASASK